MSSVLDELLAAARLRVAADRRAASLSTLRRDALRLPTARRFEAAIRAGDRIAVIGEVKRASPSEGSLAGATDLSAIARRYAAGGAVALSVLTEPTRFGGRDDDLAAVARIGLPVLRKDFVTDPYAVWQARLLGADAVLLIVRALDAATLRACLEAAGEAGIDALVEVHDSADLERALGVDATLIGANARDLDTLEIDRDAAAHLVRAAHAAGATVVAESGLRGPADGAAAVAAGADGVLVGTSLLRADDPEHAVRALAAIGRAEPRPLPPPVPLYPRVKVCGTRTPAAVRAAVSSDADMIGFVVDAASPRAVTAKRVRELAAPLTGRPRPVLVMRSASFDETSAAMRDSGVDGVQLAGHTAPPTWLARLPGEGPRIGVVHDPSAARDAIGSVEAWLTAGATHVLLEAAPAKRGGGSGSRLDMRLAQRVARVVPVGIAGGLRPETIADDVASIRPAFVDAASGLDRDGTPDPRRVAAFVRGARRDPTGSGRVNRRGRYGAFGGRFVPETLMMPLAELEAAWRAARRDPAFRAELRRLAAEYVGRPTPLFEVPAAALSAATGVAEPARLLLKREDLAHTGAHKINNALGQALLAQRMGKRRIIAETGAGQHGVAAATACALLGLDCIVYMGSTDIERQAPNVRRMELLGAEVRPVATGNGTLRDALNEALRDWVTTVETTFYVLGSATGPHPYPEMVAALQAVIGDETRRESLRRFGRLPDVLLACVGGGSNAIGFLRPFLDSGARLIGVEAGGRGDTLGDHAASLGLGRPGVLHGALTMLTQTDAGQVVEPHSVSAGLDYPGVGPQLAALAAAGRLEVDRTTDTDAVAAYRWLARATGIIPALEPAHAVASALRLLPTLDATQLVVVNLSGRGDKDLDHVAAQP